MAAWWRHQMETFSALLAICAGNSPVTGEFPAQRPVTRSFDVFFDLRLNCWVNSREDGDLRRYRAHYDVTVLDQFNTLLHRLQHFGETLYSRKTDTPQFALQGELGGVSRVKYLKKIMTERYQEYIVFQRSRNFASFTGGASVQHLHNGCVSHLATTRATKRHRASIRHLVSGTWRHSLTIEILIWNKLCDKIHNVSTGFMGFVNVVICSVI